MLKSEEIFNSMEQNDLLRLLFDEERGIIFEINGLTKQLSNPIHFLYGNFDQYRLFNINCLKDLLDYIDQKSEMLEFLGVEDYLADLNTELTSKKRVSSWYVPLEIEGKTNVFRLKALKNVKKNTVYYYFYAIDVSVLDIEKLFHDSYKDDLTGLFNFNALKLHTLNIEDTRFFGFFDLDGFKEINDTYSHAAGDEYLTMLGKMLQELAGPEITFYRRSGDEFIFMTEGISVHEVRMLVKTIQNKMKEIDFRGIHTSFSYGISEYFPECGYDVEEALQLADIGMYLSKTNGKNQATFVTIEQAKILIKQNLKDILDLYRIKTRRDVEEW